MSAREAADAFNIPRSTLGDKLRSKSQAKVTNRGGDPVINTAVEDRFVYYLKNKHH